MLRHLLRVTGLFLLLALTVFCSPRTPVCAAGRRQGPPGRARRLRPAARRLPDTLGRAVRRGRLPPPRTTGPGSRIATTPTPTCHRARPRLAGHRRRPAKHGVVGNKWYDRPRANPSTCCRVARPAGAAARQVHARSGCPTPAAQTLGDVVSGHGKVVSLSFKDRGACCRRARTRRLLLARHDAPPPSLPPRTTATASSRGSRGSTAAGSPNAGWAGSGSTSAPTSTMRPAAAPTMWSAKARRQGGPQGLAFPHPMDVGLKGPGNITPPCTTRPSATNFCWSSRAAVDAEDLGRGDAPTCCASASPPTTRSGTPGAPTRRRSSTSRCGPT